MTSMRIVFMGSSMTACRSLDRLLALPGVEVAAVLTQPDRPKGRRRKPAPSAVKSCAEGCGVPILTPSDVNAPESLAELRALEPELGVVVAFGQILRQDLLALPPKGLVNVHASLLPKYRGAAPVEWAIVNGETATGVTTMYMAERVDAGDIIRQKGVAVLPGETAGSLKERLAIEGADLLVSTVSAIAGGCTERIAQDSGEASPARKL
ncbi:MAG: methionyl-tRNA formyltransferase, partial [Lentisphaerae bacterium]|nr:methionyl-tRNA formyltransferase [Lentisphaerota bacterium]